MTGGGGDVAAWLSGLRCMPGVMREHIAASHPGSKRPARDWLAAQDGAMWGADGGECEDDLLRLPVRRCRSGEGVSRGPRGPAARAASLREAKQVRVQLSRSTSPRTAVPEHPGSRRASASAGTSPSARRRPATPPGAYSAVTTSTVARRMGAPQGRGRSPPMRSPSRASRQPPVIVAADSAPRVNVRTGTCSAAPHGRLDDDLLQVLREDAGDEGGDAAMGMGMGMGMDATTLSCIVPRSVTPQPIAQRADERAASAGLRGQVLAEETATLLHRIAQLSVPPSGSPTAAQQEGLSPAGESPAAAERPASPHRPRAPPAARPACPVREATEDPAVSPILPNLAQGGAEDPPHTGLTRTAPAASRPAAWRMLDRESDREATARLAAAAGGGSMSPMDVAVMYERHIDGLFDLFRDVRDGDSELVAAMRGRPRGDGAKTHAAPPSHARDRTAAAEKRVRYLERKVRDAHARTDALVQELASAQQAARYSALHARLSQDVYRNLQACVRKCMSVEARVKRLEHANRELSGIAETAVLRVKELEVQQSGTPNAGDVRQSPACG